MFDLGKFPSPLEESFRDQYVGRAIPYARVGLALGAVEYLLFHWWDVTLDPAHSDFAFTIRFAVAGICVAALGLSWQPFFRKYYQTILMAAVMTGGVGVVVVIASLHDGLQDGYGGVMLALIFTLSFARLFFLQASIASFVTFGFYNVVCTIFHLSLRITVINDFFLISTVFIGIFMSYMFEKQARTEFLLGKELERAREKLDNLVRDIFPERIASRLRAGEQVIAESHGEASVLFADIVGFTALAKKIAPGHLIQILNDVFTRLDELTERHGVEKIKTIGDAYMVVSGVSDESSDSVERLADFALDMQSSVDEYARNNDYPLAMRIGIATGQVISGVIGFKRLSFDLWGETVNLASRMESNSNIGCVQVSEATYWRLRNKYDFEERGMIQVKNMGEVAAYQLIRKKTQKAGVDNPTSGESFALGTI